MRFETGEAGLKTEIDWWEVDKPNKLNERISDTK